MRCRYSESSAIIPFGNNEEQAQSGHPDASERARIAFPWQLNTLTKRSFGRFAPSG